MFKSVLAQVTADKIALEEEIGAAITKQFAPEGVHSPEELELARRVVKFRMPRLTELTEQEEALTALMA